jgi:LPS sulfotransferase NodH
MLTAEEQNWRQHFQQCGVPVAHVAYEDLVRNREQELRRLITFIDPARPLASTLVLNEPASGEALRARQYVSAAGREALYKAYEERFGPVVPLPEPGKVGVRVGSG